MIETILYSAETEQALLGSVIVDGTLVDDLTPNHESFFIEKNRMICRELHEMKEKGKNIDLITLSAHLAEKGLMDAIGGIGYLSDLANSIPSTENFKDYQTIVLEKYKLRQAVKLADDLKKGIISEQNIHVVDDVIDQLQTLDQGQRKKRRKLADVLVDTYDNLEQRIANKGKITGIPTGFSELDRILNGLHPGDLCIVAARPSVGKTAFALNIGTNVSKPEIGDAVTGVFSLEMADDKLAERQISSEGNIDAQNMRLGQVGPGEWTNLTMALGGLSKLDMFLYDDPNVTVQDIRAEVRALRKDFPDRHIVIMIDYLQLIQYAGPRKGTRNEEVSYISRNLKLIAREFNVVMIALSQLSRGVEQRQDKRPMMSDIRDSGSIEQDADVVAFLYRDDYYNKETENKNIIEIIVAKQRNGPIGTVQLAFVKEYNKFVNLERRFS